LREAVIIRAIAASWITDVDHTNLDNSVELLLDVRDALHQVTESSNDVLLRQEQAEVAALLHYPNSETLLRSVAKAAKSIAHLSDVAWYRVTANHQRASFLGKLRKSERTPLADGVVVENKEVYLAKEANLRTDPNLLLRAAAASAQAGLIFSPHILDRLKYGVTKIEYPFDQAARDSLVSLLGSGKFLLTIWDSLDENELIDKFLPIWQRVRSLPQSSPVHIWTVDRHLLETVIHAVELSRGVSRPDLLFVGCLLHDIGKGELTDHTLVGMKIAQEVVPQLGFDPSETDIIVRLIEHHLLLSETATKRDLTDKATIDFVKEKVKTQEFLDLLYALTLADAAATGPLVNTDWRKHLIDQLYESVKLELQDQPKKDYDKSIIDLEKYYDSNVDFSLVVEIKKPATEIVVLTQDHPRLLAQIAAVLSFHRLEIKSARTKTINNQAITTWLVNPEFGEFPDVKILELDLRNALTGRIDILEKLNTRASYQKIPFDTPPATVAEVIDINSQQTLIEVRAHNQSGLLAKLAATISELNVLIQAAIVQTLGSEVVDVFYVTELNEDKLSTERVTQLIKALDYACTHVRSTI
jgi:[protein-PII] uridylyltransferase